MISWNFCQQFLFVYLSLEIVNKNPKPPKDYRIVGVLKQSPSSGIKI